MDTARQERLARLWSPPNGRASSELDITSPAAVRVKNATESRQERSARRKIAIDAMIEAAARVAADWRATHTFETIGPRQQCAEIIKVSCAHFGLRRVEIMSHRRTKNITYPRQVAMYFMAEFTANSLPEIGRRFGGFDHTTVLHAWRKIKARLPTDAKLQADIAAIRVALEIETP